MSAPILSDRDLEFMIYELFDAEGLTSRERYQDHSRETYAAAIATGKTVAERYFLPIRQRVDIEQPVFDGEKAITIPEIKTAIEAVFDSGLANPSASFDHGGMQLPAIVACAATAYLSAAGSATLGYASLTNANCNLLEAYGSQEQIDKWVLPQREGRFAGTMALTEPGAGSGLADLTTSAVPADDGSYRITGNKIYISGGDHEITENIVHLVLAKIKGAPAGVHGISLFIVPKYMVNDDGSVGERNDVSLAGLFHKMGGRGHTSCALSFGEKGGAVGYLVGEAHKGLFYMFHMMNEARIMVGTGAAVTGLTGYQYSLYYAKERPQGRLPSCKDPLSKPVNIIEHADVRRMLLAQKAYTEGGYALCLYGAQLSDDHYTAETQEERDAAYLLLDFLTPIFKSWPSEYGPRANNLAIQVLGGHGYTSEYPVEMFYRDNRLNPIHEGTYGIQSLDLLARKVPQKKMAGYRACIEAMRATVAETAGNSELAEFSAALGAAIDEADRTTMALMAAMGSENIDLVLANSVKYLEMLGNVLVAWIWLRQGAVASAALQGHPHEQDQAFYHGKLQAMQYFFRFDLPEIYVWSKILASLDDTTYAMQKEWF